MAGVIKLKQTRYLLTLLAFILCSGFVSAQNLMQQKLTFSLFDKTGKQLTDADFTAGQIKVFSLREAKVASYPKMSYNKDTKQFTFTESVMSPGIVLAFATPTDTMYISVYGRNTDRLIDGITVQNGSYILTSNEFAGQKQLKVKDWANYLEDETPAAKQDLSSYVEILKEKSPVALVKTTDVK